MISPTISPASLLLLSGEFQAVVWLAIRLSFYPVQLLARLNILTMSSGAWSHVRVLVPQTQTSPHGEDSRWFLTTQNAPCSATKHEFLPDIMHTFTAY